jgi:outer membrane protein OmpA-like peptidoglycan-associated protein
MKKLVLSIAAIAMTAMPALAQESVVAPSKAGDNWFIQLQGGINYTISENHKQSSFGDVIAPHVALSFGKLFTPVFGARLGVGGWESKNYYEVDSKTTGTYKVKYVQTNLDALVNLTNAFLPYKENRVFNLYGIAGLGYFHGFKSTKHGIGTNNIIAPRAGFMADFRLSQVASINLEVAGNLLRDDFNGRVVDRPYDGVIDAMLGLKFNLGKSGFRTVTEGDPEALRRANNEINSQRAALNSKDSEIDRLKRELAVKPEPQVIVKETKEVTEETEVLMNAVVVFRLFSAQLEKNQDINIYNAARYLKDNPNVKVTVTGYADKSTGTAAVNQRLSEQRAQAVAKVLIEKYDIAASRITTKASGDKEQLFPTDEWNRVVVFTATGK